jgi:hypothetical protein
MFPSRPEPADMWFVQEPSRLGRGETWAVCLALVAGGAGVILFLIFVSTTAGAAGGCGGG